jgi:hypothetical protein
VSLSGKLPEEEREISSSPVKRGIERGKTSRSCWTIIEKEGSQRVIGTVGGSSG